MALAGNVLTFAVHGTNEVVVLSPEQLPEDANEILDLLTSEALPLGKWYEVARAYLSQNKLDKFLAVLREATDDSILNEVESFFHEKPTFELCQLHCAYAAHHIEVSKEEKNKTERNKLQSSASSRIAQAKQLDSNEMLPFLAAGMLALAKGDQQAAMVEFRAAANKRHNKRRNIAPLLAQAALQFHSGKIAEALDLYRRALREHPGAPPQVRLGIAACFFRAGRPERAAAAYERVLALDPGNADALLGLTVLKLMGGDAQGLASGLELLVRAYHADPHHAGVLVMLAHFNMLAEDAERAHALALRALEGAETDALRARAHTTMARAAHKLGRLADARALYAAASRLDPKQPLPHLGSAQMALLGGEHINAATELEAVLDAVPACPDALRVLGDLLPLMPGRVAKTIAHFRDAAQRRPGDAEVQEMLGELLSSTDPAGSLAAYKAALDLHRAQHKAVAEQQVAAHRRNEAAAKARFAEVGDDHLATVEPAVPVPPDYHLPSKLLNNAAVLFYRAGKVHEALALVQESTANMLSAREGPRGLDALGMVTQGFNLARLQEATGDVRSAAAGYKALLDQFPGYIDCYLRLACIARSAGNMDEAVEWARRATQREGGHADAQALLATLFLHKNELRNAKACLDTILNNPATKSDPYAKLVLASFYLRSMPAAKGPEEKEAARKYLGHAQRLYREVLAAEPHNIYAANGAGVVLAESGRLDAARDAFVVVQEAAAASGAFLKLPDVWLNLAHMHLAKKEYASALQLYGNASRHTNNKNAATLLCLARAHYDADDLPAARCCLLRAIHIAPTDARLRFNAALTLQEWAVRLYKKPRPSGDPSKLAEFEAGAEALNQAARVFRHLQSLGKEVTRIEQQKLAMHVEFCQKTLVTASHHIRTAEAEAQKLSLQRAQQEEQLRRAQAERMQQELVQRAMVERARKEREEQARRAHTELEAKLSTWRTRAAEASAPADGDAGGKAGGKRKRRKAAAGEADDFIVDDAAPTREGRRYRDTADAHAATGLASDDEDGGGGGGPGDIETLFGSEGEADEDFDPAAEEGSGGGSGGGAPGGSGGGAPGGSGGGGRLKRRRAEAEDGGDVAGLFDEPEDEEMADEGEGAPDDEGGGRQAGAASAEKRRRQRVTTIESDDEDGGGGGGADGTQEGGGGGGGANGGDGAAGVEDEEGFDDMF